MGNYSLKMCRIESEYAALDDTIDKKLWLKEQIDQLVKEYEHDLKLFKSEFSFVYKGLMNLLDKEERDE